MPRLEDRAAVRRILHRDRAWAVYMLADLAPPYAAHAEWHAAAGGSALVLLYRGLQVPVAVAFGAAEGVAALVPELAGVSPLYLAIRDEHAAAFAAAGYRIEAAKRMRRMVLGAFQPCAAGGAERLGPGDAAEVESLYTDGAAAGESPLFYDHSMLADGVYYGVREEGQLVAAAGTHVFTPAEGVGGIGNVYTRRGWRGRGLAARATSAVTAELLRHGIGTVALNVAADHHAAIRVYQRLGFATHCEYLEAVGRV